MSSTIKGKAKRFGWVACAKHGTPTDKNNLSWVRVQVPKSKRDKNAGCPQCRKTANALRKVAS